MLYIIALSFNKATGNSLSSLNLSFNLLDSPKDLKGAHFELSLKTLDVSLNHLSRQQVFPWVFSQGCEKLTHLALKGNKLQGTFSLNGCSNFEYLDLSSNNISSSIPNFGENFPNLKYLDLSLNKFNGRIDDNVLVGCNSLSFLNVSGITRFMVKIPPEMKQPWKERRKRRGKLTMVWSFEI